MEHISTYQAMFLEWKRQFYHVLRPELEQEQWVVHDALNAL
jgi:hypothetical protein